MLKADLWLLRRRSVFEVVKRKGRVLSLAAGGILAGMAPAVPVSALHLDRCECGCHWWLSAAARESWRF